MTATTAERPTQMPMGKSGTVQSTILRAPFEAKTWLEIAYVLVALVLGPAGIVYLFFGLGGGLLLAVTVVGIPLLAAVVAGGRVWGYLYRGLAKALLRTHIDAPPRFRPAPGVFGFAKAGITDRVGWRALAFVLVKGLLGPVLGYLALTFLAMAVFTAISPIPWLVFHPTNVDANGVEHHSLAQFGNFYIETWPRVIGLSLIGIAAVFLAPWPIRGIAELDRYLVRTLLGPTDRDRRVAQLEQSRTAAVEDSAATLRRVERDLHDGTQARLVSMAMALGRAEERLAAGGDATDLVHDAHATAKDALRELRDVVRGIHPPALDIGLGPALETLAARSAVPVELTVEVTTRPSPGVETIAYFAVAELLTNVAKHANARQAWVDVRDVRGNIVVTVRDDGIGGANPAVGSGLTGLRGRASTVDGSLAVVSPAGGPTVVTMTLPATS